MGIETIIGLVEQAAAAAAALEEQARALTASVSSFDLGQTVQAVKPEEIFKKAVPVREVNRPQSADAGWESF